MAKFPKSFWQQLAHKMNEADNASEIVDEVCRKFPFSRQTVYRNAKNKGGYKSGRKTREDCGRIAPQLKTALMDIYKLHHAHIKKEANSPLELAVMEYQKSKPEIQLPSVSHIRLLGRKLGISRRDARRTTPKLHIKCNHSNHVHFLDTSICRYYLTKKNNIAYLPSASEYKNKPNRHSTKQVLIRYVVIDGASGAFYLWYETTQQSIDFAEFLYDAWNYKEDFPFWGAPIKLVTDNDSGLRSHSFLRLMDYLDIEIPKVMPYSPWVKGYVEKTLHLVELWFESRFLWLQKRNEAIDVNQVNNWAREWAIEFQATRIHTRHGMTRTDAWQKHIDGHLRELPDYRTYQTLMHTDPEVRTVDPRGGLRWKSKDKKPNYIIKDTELYGKKVDVVEHPYDYQKTGAITIIYPSVEENQNNFLTPEKKKYTILPVKRDALGYPENAHPWGEYKGLRHTESMRNLQDVEKAEMPDINPMKFGNHKRIYLKQKSEKIQVATDNAPRNIEYTKRDVKRKLVSPEYLNRHLTEYEIATIRDLNKDVFTAADIESLSTMFRSRNILSIAGSKGG